MSRWDDFDVENKITAIFSQVPDYAPGHHLGRPFLTAYQVAIEYAHRHANDVQQWGLQVGGTGTGQRNSISQYLAQQLSARISDGRITHIEGSFLSNQHLDSVTFEHGDEIIHSSLTNTPFTLSMYRLRPLWQRLLRKRSKNALHLTPPAPFPMLSRKAVHAGVAGEIGRWVVHRGLS